MINELIKKYAEIQLQEELIKAQKDALKLEIVEAMNNLGEDKYVSPDNISATLVNKETFKYNDELAMISYLKENGYNQFVVEKIDAVKLNKELKGKTVLTEALSSMVTRTNSTALTVKNL